MTVHKFMKMWQCIKGNKKKCLSILAWIFHFLPLVFSHIFDLEDMCLFSNGFKSFGNISSTHFLWNAEQFIIGWNDFQIFRFLIFKSLPNCFRISSKFSVQFLIAEIELMIFSGADAPRVEMSISHRIETRDQAKGMALLLTVNIFFRQFSVEKMFNNNLQLHRSRDDKVKKERDKKNYSCLIHYSLRGEIIFDKAVNIDVHFGHATIFFSHTQSQLQSTGNYKIITAFLSRAAIKNQIVN